MKTLKIHLTIFTCFFLTLFAAMSSPHKGLDTKVDSLLRAHYGPEDPGGAIAVISGEGVLLKKCFGMMDLARNQNVDEHTLFDIASVAKQFTAFAILLLEEQGQLNLDDNVRKYIPELPMYEHEVTLRQLMHHTSGVPSTDVLRLIAGLSLDEIWTQQQEMELLRSYPNLNFPPNSEYLYSNGGYSLLATVVENVSGLNFADFMQKQVFAPLGMKSSLIVTGFPSDSSFYATGYKKSENDFQAVSSISDFSYGGGNMYASIDDMIQWAGNLLSPTTGNPAFYEQLKAPHHTLDNGDTISYTHGFFARTYKSLPVADHSGGVPGFRSLLMYFPSEQTIIILLTNQENRNFRTIVNEMAEILLEEKLVEQPVKPRVAIDIDVESVKSFEGNYRLADGMELAFQMEKDTFWLLLPGDEKFQLFAEKENHFFLKAFDAQCTFVVSNDGNVDEMIWHQGGADYPGRRVSEPVPFPLDEMHLLAGNYQPAGFDALYEIRYEDDTFTLFLPETFEKYIGFGTSEMTHVNGDMFYLDKLGAIEFSRNEKGRINGFVLQNLGRLRNVHFEKMKG